MRLILVITNQDSPPFHSQNIIVSPVNIYGCHTSSRVNIFGLHGGEMFLIACIWRNFHFFTSPSLHKFSSLLGYYADRCFLVHTFLPTRSPRDIGNGIIYLSRSLFHVVLYIMVNFHVMKFSDWLLKWYHFGYPLLWISVRHPLGQSTGI